MGCARHPGGEAGVADVVCWAEGDVVQVIITVLVKGGCRGDVNGQAAGLFWGGLFGSAVLRSS